jgi:ketosteroid isomerase-like protein
MNPTRLFQLAVTLVLLAVSSVRAAPDAATVQSAIRAVLDQQVKDWNAGDIEKFMRGYDRSEKTRFASGGNITLGWQAVMDRYRRTYSDKAAMGTLTFSDLDITVASEESALAFGRWHLKREKDEPSGLFTLLFRKTADGWKIVHDHTSAAEKK